jgi:hypothetical protein
MRIRIESPFPISAGIFKPVKQRRVAVLGHTVHWYDVKRNEIDTFLRSVYNHYRYHYHNDIHGAVRYQWYASLTLYYRGTTVSLNLSYTRLYDYNEYRLQYRQELDSTFGFWPESIESWQFDSAHNSLLFADVRAILNRIITGVTE